MNARVTIVLVIIVAVLGFVTLKSKQSEKSRKSLPGGEIFPGLEPTSIVDIELSADENTVHLVRNPDGWLVATEGNHPADTLAVGQLLDKIETFDRKHLISSNPDKQITFEVDDQSGTEVILSGADGDILAHFRMGKNGPDHRSQYIRPAGSNEVFCIPDYLRSVFDAGRATWRDKTIFKFDQNLVKNLLVKPADKPSVELIKNSDGSFVVTAPESIPAVKHTVDTMVRMMCNLKCDSFPDSLITLEAAGLRPPQQSLTINLNDGAAYSLLVGHPVDENKYYVGKEGDDTVFILSKGRVSGMIHDANDLMDKTEPPSDAQPVLSTEPE